MVTVQNDSVVLFGCRICQKMCIFAKNYIMLEIWKSHELKVVGFEGEKLLFDAAEHGTLEVENIDLVKKYEIGETESIFLYNGPSSVCLPHRL